MSLKSFLFFANRFLIAMHSTCSNVFHIFFSLLLQTIKLVFSTKYLTSHGIMSIFSSILWICALVFNRNNCPRDIHFDRYIHFECHFNCKHIVNNRYASFQCSNPFNSLIFCFQNHIRARVIQWVVAEHCTTFPLYSTLYNRNWIATATEIAYMVLQLKQKGTKTVSSSLVEVIRSFVKDGAAEKVVTKQENCNKNRTKEFYL